MTKSVIKNAGRGVKSQCQIVKWGKNSSSCANVPGSFADVAHALLDAGVINTGDVANGSITYAQVQSEVSANRVVMVRWGWKPNTSATGHMVGIRGFNTGDGSVSYIDPTKSAIQVKSYAWMKSNDAHLWTDTRWHVWA